MYEMDKYATLMENKRILIAGSAIFILFLLLIFGGDDVETSAGEITMPSALEQQEKSRAESPRRILGAEKANLDEKLADPFSVAHLTREEMEQVKLAAERKQREDMRLKEQPEVQVPIATVQREDKSEGNDGNKVKSMMLQGIVKGEHGSMAIFTCGDKSMTVAVGETVGGRTVREIGSKEVSFEDGGRISLQTPN